jgi:non-ribosomal peptide synthetase component F
MEPARGNRVGRQNFQDIYALTPMQEGMLSLYLEDPQGDLNVEQLCLQVSGNIDVEAFGWAWNLVVQANDVLRTVFRWEHVNRPVQIVLKEHTLKPDYHDLSNKSESRKAQLLREYRALERKKGFDLREVPFRVSLCRVEAERHEVIIGHHHILFDGWSYGILLKEFLEAYGGQAAPPVKTPFKEYVRWLQKKGTGRKTGRKKGTGRKRGQAIEGEHFDCPFPEEIDDRIRRFTEAHRITVASVLYAAWGILLQKYQAAPQALFDTTVSGRTARLKGIEEMVGLFIDTLPLMVQTRPGETIGELFRRINRALPVREHHGNTDGIGEGLFDSLVVVENYPLASRLLQKGGRLSFDSYSIDESSTYDLTVIITVFDGIKASFSCDARLFDEETIGRISRHFVKIVDESLGAPGTEVAALHIVPEEEIEKLRRDLNSRRRTLSAKSDGGAAYLAPRDEVEQKLVDIWSEVLQVARDRISIDADFFDFGGHSLKASILASKVHNEFNVKVPLAEIFNTPTIRGLATFVRGASIDIYVPIRPVPPKEYYALSSAQERLYMLHKIQPSTTAYNGFSIMLLEGLLDKIRLEKSMKNLITRHEILRTSFEQIDGKPVQKVHPDVHFNVEYFYVETDIEIPSEDRKIVGKQRLERKTWQNDDQKAAVNNIIDRFIRPFDLSEAPLMRVGLIIVRENIHLLMVDMHHIITDGSSLDIFKKEFVKLYNGEELPAPKLQYKDFSEWQKERICSGELKHQEDYWLSVLSGEIPVLNLPGDYYRPEVQSLAGETVSFHLERESYVSLNSLMKKTNTTLFMVILSIYNILLGKYSGQQDIIVGIPIAGRNNADLLNIMGFFVETLALRNYPREEKAYEVFLKEVKNNTLKSFENQDYPFKELLNKVYKKSDLSRNPLFDAMLIMQNVNISDLEMDGLRCIPYKFDSRTSKLDLTLNVMEVDGEIVLELEYSTALFKRLTAEEMVSHYTEILGQVLQAPKIKLKDITLSNPDNMVSVKTNFTRRDYTNFEF